MEASIKILWVTLMSVRIMKLSEVPGVDVERGVQVLELPRAAPAPVRQLREPHVAR